MQAQVESLELISSEDQGTFLPPIEKPRGLMMKLAYAMARRQLGKVITPLKVFCARLPVSFGQFDGKIGALDKKLELPPETVMLIRELVAQTNVCLFCIDIGRYFTIKQSMNQAKFDALGQYRTSSLFTDAERAALDYVTQITRDKRVEPETYSQLARYYSERQICGIVWLVASEHFYNLTNIALNIHSDMFCHTGKKASGALCHPPTDLRARPRTEDALIPTQFCRSPVITIRVPEEGNPYSCG
jgi:alkylhydroperoxidase family enzyme